MNVVVKLLVVSINWMDSNYYTVLEDGEIPEEKIVPSDVNQPSKISLDMAEEIVPVSKNWMNTDIVSTYYSEDKLNIVYRIIIPHDPELKLSTGCEWVNIKKFYSEDQYLKEALEKAIRGIV